LLTLLCSLFDPFLQLPENDQTVAGILSNAAEFWNEFKIQILSFPQPQNPAHFPAFYVRNDIQHYEPPAPRAPRIHEPRPPRMVPLTTLSWKEYLDTPDDSLVHPSGVPKYTLRGAKVECRTKTGVLLGGPDTTVWVRCTCDECDSKPDDQLASNGGSIFHGIEWCEKHAGKFFANKITYLLNQAPGLWLDGGIRDKFRFSHYKIILRHAD